MFACLVAVVALAGQSLAQEVASVAHAAKGRVGAAVIVIETGETILNNDAGRYPMQSVYKFPIAMACLSLVDRGRLSLSQQIRMSPADYVPKSVHSPLRDEFPAGTTISLSELLRLAILESDGSASDMLLRLEGGKEAAERYVLRLGIRGVKIRSTEREMGTDESAQYRSWAHPSDAARLLIALWQGNGLSATSRQLLISLMTKAMTGANRIRAGLPPGTPLTHKTGTSGMEHGTAAATNDVGLVTLPNGRHLVISVFVSDSRADEATRDAVIAKIAKAAWDHYK